MRASIGLFLGLLLTSAWFYQGGGWNQNVRFAQTRAIAETGTFAIDDFLFYQLRRDAEGAVDYRRVTTTGPPVRRLPEPTGLDLSVFEERIYPNKPPGVSWLGALFYAPFHQLGRVAGLDPDGWLGLTLGLYLTTLATVGLAGALGCVVFLDLARRLFPELPDDRRLAAALTLGMGTLWLPYSTMLFDHVPVAAFSLLAFSLIRAAAAPAVEVRRAGLLLFGAGFGCGLLVLLNYGAALTVVCLVVYAFAITRPVVRGIWLLAGGVLPALALAGYHQACFGSPFTIAYQHELEIFRTAEAAVLRIFDLPQPGILLQTLVGPYRGLLVTSPVLALAGYGVFVMIRRPATRPEGWLVATVTALYLLQIAAFNGWHGGSAIGPRYMMTAIPFLALGLVPAFARLPRLTGTLAALSAGILLVVTAVDPQVDVEIQNPLRDYYAPLAMGGEYRLDEWVMRGPVSVQTYGAAGGEIESFDPDSRIARWNSFNLGEFWFPGSWLSLVPLLTAWVVIASACFQRRPA